MFSFKAFESALRAPWAKRFGLLRVTEPSGRPNVDYAKSNNFPELWKTADGTSEVEAVRVDANNDLQIGGAYAVQPMRIPCTFNAILNGEIVTTCFHIFNYSGRIVAVEEIHKTAGNDAGAVTLHVTKDKSGQAPGAGVTIQSGTFNLKGTASTRQVGTLTTTLKDREFVAGDRLSCKLTGTPTTAAGVTLVVWVQPYIKALDVSFYAGGQTSTDQAFFIANRPYAIYAVRYAHKTAETTAATLAVQLTNDTSTNAPGAGTDILTNNSNAGFNGKATANVPQVGTFAATTIAAGNRLSLDWSASHNELAGCVCTVTLVPQANRLEVSLFDIDTDVTDATFFLANRDFEVYDARQVHAVAAGGASVAQLVKDASTDAPGAGTDLLATTWDLNGTANTPQIAAFVATATKSSLLMVSGDRLAIDYANTEQSLAGLVKTVSLLAR